MNSSLIKEITRAELSTNLLSHKRIGGGCINTTEKVITTQGSYFIKLNDENYEEMFIMESEGLSYLRDHSTIRIPKIICQGRSTGKSYLILEWIERGTMSTDFWTEFGQQLALLHKVSISHFGFHQDNYLGTLPQSNKQHSSWYDFFVAERLEPQIRLAVHKKLIDSGTVNELNKLFPKLETLIPKEPPSLLHGDLWSGNFMVDEYGSPVLVDPAVHYGHRETEIAFTHLFGGFDEQFYASYEEAFPLQPGFVQRKAIHHLYPLLVHVNLFGSSYLLEIRQTLKRFA